MHEGHEAIRPTVIGREPSQIRSFLSDEQYKLYLLTARTVACQMIPATIAQLPLTCRAVRATCSVRTAPPSRTGFLQVYEEGQVDRMAKHLPAGKLLPPLKVGMRLSQKKSCRTSILLSRHRVTRKRL